MTSAIDELSLKELYVRREYLLKQVKRVELEIEKRLEPTTTINNNPIDNPHNEANNEPKKVIRKIVIKKAEKSPNKTPEESIKIVNKINIENNDLTSSDLTIITDEPEKVIRKIRIKKAV